jgi:hypothetical protein
VRIVPTYIVGSFVPGPSVLGSGSDILLDTGPYVIQHDIHFASLRRRTP